LGKNVYDGMFILDAGRYARDPEGVSGQISKIIVEEGGEILVSRLWEERRLAFPIKGQRKGVYWLTYFRLDGDRLGGLRQRLRLNVDTLVAHALAGPAAMAAERRAAEAREKEAEAQEHEGEQAVPAGRPAGGGRSPAHDE